VTKKFLKSNKNIVESYSRRLEQVEDRISGLEDKMLKKKAE
jgi:Mg2+ and Co2+ transporter CorA